MTTQTTNWESGAGGPPPPEAKSLPVHGLALHFLNRLVEMLLAQAGHETLSGAVYF
jgi:hypothetical protein